jgi:hypothetical protein
VTETLVYDDGVIVGKGETFEFVQLRWLSEPSPNYFSPLFEIATVTTWWDIGIFVHSLYKGLLSDAGPLRISDGLTKQLASVPNVDGKVRLIIEYVQDQLIYLFDAEVMHAHVPQSVQQVLDTKSGDCKAKSLALVRLLNTIGVDGTIVLINYSLDRYIEDVLPSPFVFNHAIVRLKRNGKHYFVDPTWSNRSGSLDCRGEPVFSTFCRLTVRPDSVIEMKRPRQFLG